MDSYYKKILDIKHKNYQLSPSKSLIPQQHKSDLKQPKQEKIIRPPSPVLFRKDKYRHNNSSQQVTNTFKILVDKNIRQNTPQPQNTQSPPIELPQSHHYQTNLQQQQQQSEFQNESSNFFSTEKVQYQVYKDKNQHELDSNQRSQLLNQYSIERLPSEAKSSKPNKNSRINFHSQIFNKVPQQQVSNLSPPKRSQTPQHNHPQLIVNISNKQVKNRALNKAINLKCFENCKTHFQIKYATLQQNQVKQITQNLQKNRITHNPKFKMQQKKQIKTPKIMDHQETKKKKFQNKSPIMIQQNNFQNEVQKSLDQSLISPVGDSIIVDDGINMYISNNVPDQVLIPYQSSKNKSPYQPDKNFVQMLQIDLEKQKERMDFIRGGKKRKTTLGEKFYFLNSVDDRYLQNEMNLQQKKLEKQTIH